MIVLCDLDGIVCDLLDEWLLRYNFDHGLDITKADITDWNIHKCVPHGEAIYDYIRKPGIYDGLRPLPGAVEALESIDDKWDLVILSTPSSCSRTASEKLDWCKEHLPFIDKRQIILAERKDLVHGDFLIDDAPHNLHDWGHWNGFHQGKTITIDYPYNREVAVNFRAHNYQDTKQAWGEIRRYLGVA